MDLTTILTTISLHVFLYFRPIIPIKHLKLDLYMPIAMYDILALHYRHHMEAEDRRFAMRPFYSIKHKLPVLFIAVGLLPAIIIGTFFYIYTKNELTDHAQNQLQAHAYDTASRFNTFFKQAETTGDALSHFPIFHRILNDLASQNYNYNDSLWLNRIDDLRQITGDLREQYGFNFLYLTDAEGSLIFESAPSTVLHIGDNILDIADKRGYGRYVENVLSGVPTWRPQAYSNVNADYNLIYMVPILEYGNQGPVVGALYLSYGQEQLESVLFQDLNMIGATANAYLIDSNRYLRSDSYRHDFSMDNLLTLQLDTPIAHSYETRFLTPTIPSPFEIYNDTRNKEVIGQYALSRLGTEPVAIIIELETSEVYAPLATYRRTVSMVVFGAIFILIISAHFVSNTITVPLQSITDWTKSLSSGNYFARLTTRSHQEIDELANSLRQMVDDITIREEELIAQNEELESNYTQISSYSSEVDRLNSALVQQANHDSLTTLPNRKFFIDRLSSILGEGKEGAIIILDLNNFKEINDSKGHIYGDAVLNAFGKRLAKLRDSYDYMLAARYGGDEFLILIENNTPTFNTAYEIQKIEDLLAPSFSVESDSIDLNYSMGISLFPNDSTNCYHLITYADTAMYYAKNTSHTNIMYYSEQMIHDIKEKRFIKDLIQVALEENQFELYYQPQVNLKNGQIDCMEALIRLKNAPISPGIFIPLAEESRQILSIGRWVTKTVIMQLAKWQDEGIAIVPISINFSTKQLEDHGYITYLSSLLQDYDIDPAFIEIEITESVLFEKNQNSLSYLQRLRELGIRLSLDDFGAGYSSFNYLTFIDLDKIKLDKQFNAHFLVNEHKKTMDNLIRLFHGLNLTIVAEGIEHSDDVDELSAMNCDYIQGYVFSKPVPTKDVPTLVDHTFDLSYPTSPIQM